MAAPTFDALVGAIYDSAADPGEWPRAMAMMCEAFGAAYIMLGTFDLSPLDAGLPPNVVTRHSDWDPVWLQRLSQQFRRIPSREELFDNDIDIAWTQMSHMREADFRRTQFYEEWVKPQNLRDTINVSFVRREKFYGVFGAPRLAGRPLYGAREMRLCEALSPHLRRAFAINHLVDSAEQAQALYQAVLDRMTAPVILTGPGHRVVFANQAAERLLSAGHLATTSGGCLVAHPDEANTMLGEALDRAATSDAALGLRGIGVPLVAADGQRAAAYVLPIAGTSLRRELGRGHAAVFIAMRGEQQPMLIEILRTLHDLTPAQARVAAMVADGQSPAQIAAALRLSVNTVRSHLAQTFAKTNCPDQTMLAAVVRALVPPVL